MPANDNKVIVQIIGDASGVAPAVGQAGDALEGLAPLLAELNSQIALLTAQMREGFIAGAGAARQLATGINETKVAAEGASIGIGAMVSKIHEGAESVRTFQMRAKEFAELYVAMFGIEAIAHWAESLGAAAEHVAHLAAQTGMTTGQVQGLSAAATMSGSSIDALVKGVSMLDNRAVTSAGHVSTASKALAAMGISANDGTSSMQRLMIVADKFHGMADGPEKAALAMQLFGRSGRDMIPFLNQGSEAIQGLIDRSKEYGAVNDKAQAQGERLAESVNVAKVAWEGLKNTLTEAFGPMLTSLVDGFSELVKEMHDSYESGGAVKIIFDAIAEVCQALGEMVSAVALGFSSFFSVTSGQGLDWAAIIKGVIDGIVIAFKTVVAMVVFVADGFVAAFHLMKAGAEDFLANFTELTGGIRVVGTGLGEFMQVLSKVCWDALHLEWGSIKSDWESGMEQVHQAVAAKANEIVGEVNRMKNAVKSDFDDMLNTGKQFGSFYDQLMNGSAAAPHAPIKMNFGGGAGDAPDITNPGKGKKEKKPKDDLVQRLEEELQAKKNAWNEEQLAQGTAQQYSLQSEADFWQQALGMADLSAKDRVKVEQKYITAAQALQKEQIEAKLEGYKEDLDRAGSNAAAKLKILENEQAYIVRMYGAQSKEALAAAKAVADAKKEEAKQVEAIQDEIAKHQAQLEAIGVEEAEANAKLAVEMGQETKGRLLSQEKHFEDQRFAIQIEALQKQKALIDPNRDPAQYQKICDQIELLERQHQQKLTEIDRQQILQRTALERQGINSIASSWAQQIAQLATLQQGFFTTLKGLYQGLQQAAAQALESILEKFIATELTKLIYGKATATSMIAAESAKAGAGGVASMAAAPWPLDMTAPAFGASMSAAAMAFSGLNSAEGGDWNVNPGLYMLHSKEMVLPAWAAQGVRNMIGSGTAPAANTNTPSAANDGGDTHLHFHGVVMSPPAMELWARQNRHFFGAGAKEYLKQGGR